MECSYEDDNLEEGVKMSERSAEIFNNKMSNQVVRQDKGVFYSGWDSHRGRLSRSLVASVGHHRVTYDGKRTQLDSRR